MTRWSPLESSLPLLRKANLNLCSPQNCLCSSNTAPFSLHLQVDTHQAQLSQCGRISDLFGLPALSRSFDHLLEGLINITTHIHGLTQPDQTTAHAHLLQDELTIHTLFLLVSRHLPCSAADYSLQSCRNNRSRTPRFKAVHRHPRQ